MMDQYSQHNLKVAATKPEHVVRKAELDAVIASLTGLGGGEDLTALATVNQSSLVGAINEIFWDQMDSKEILAQTIGGVEYSTFAKLVQAVTHAKTSLANHMTLMGILGVANEPLQSLIDRIPQIPFVGSEWSQELLFRNKLLAWCPFRPFPGLFTRTGIQPESLQSTGGGNATGNIINAEWHPTIGVRFRNSRTQNNNRNGALSLANNQTNTIWWRPYVWPENMSIIRYGHSDGWRGSGLKVKDGRLVILAEVMYTTVHHGCHPDGCYGHDYSCDNARSHIDNSTYVDLGPFDSTHYPPDTWRMIAVKSKTLPISVNGWERTRTVNEYWMDGVKIDIPYPTTSTGGSYYYYGYNSGAADHVHLGSRVWSIGEPIAHQNPPDYSGWFLDWRGYQNLNDEEIAALYAAGPYQI